MEITRSTFALSLAALTLTAVIAYSNTPAIATSVDYEHLPVNDLQAELVHNGWTSPNATVMVGSLNREARAVSMPVDLLFGAIDQESKFNNYGVNYDFGNYSCGIAQANIAVWCSVASASGSSRSQYNWPSSADCDDLQNQNANIMGPLLNAVKATHALGAQGALAPDFQKLNPQAMTAQMPGDSAEQKQAYYQAAMSFANNCSKSEEGLKIASTQIRMIYDQYVPAEVKSSFPHTSWVLADAIYNIGPGLITILQQNGGAQVWQTLTPQKIIDIETNVMNAMSGTITVQTPDDDTVTIDHFHLCVNQRHIQNVMRDTLPAAMKSVINASTQTCKP